MEIRPVLACAALTASLVVAGCSAEPTPASYITESTSSTPEVSTVTVTATTTAPAPVASCGYPDGDTAVRANLHQLQPVRSDWDPDHADTSGYDACADLSWAVISIEQGSSSSPFQIMLFHQGEYLGTGTLDAYAFMPTVTRTSDNSIAVTYHYPLPGESNAMRSGETHATFTWSDAENRVIMEGDVPAT
ncbi:LppP/LprE family lipoprotein [Corynebacterium renale]|uniref:LppP/LprE lipoprotein n=1 Tax=Corynebacterium renale TaxID=1724 RepID=A0A2A9DLP4_9CORY|nr:LppP/LprE family lipoprotein [Corynebacterium renale]PFG27618.1 LppP/LprE lipoprotein [Corynebacterium renale]SQI22798.1 Uncharacterised protein [Corynebacterium renale]